MSGLIQKVFDAVTKHEPKDVESGPAGKKLFTRIDSVEQGRNILAAAEEAHASGKFKADVEISTCVEKDLVKFLNYAVTLIHNKYALHKMLLVLRVNPIHINEATGKGTYLSKKYIAQELTKHTKRLVMESEIEKLEKEAIRICQDAIRKTRDTALPILN